MWQQPLFHQRKSYKKIHIQSSTFLYNTHLHVTTGFSADSKEEVGQVAEAIRNLLVNNGLDVPSSKCQGLGQEFKFLGAWWVSGAVVVPDQL